MSSTKLKDLKSELKVEKKQEEEQSDEQVAASLAREDSWIAVKPIEVGANEAIVNIISLSVDYDKVYDHFSRSYAKLTFS